MSTQQVPRQWQEKLRVVHARINKAVEDLPAGIEAPVVSEDECAWLGAGDSSICFTYRFHLLTPRR